MNSSRLLFVAAVSLCGLIAAAGCSDDSEGGDAPGGGGAGNEGGEAGEEQGGNGGEAGQEQGNGGAAGKGGAGTGGAQAGSGGSQAGNGGSQAGNGGSATGGSGTGGSGGSTGKIVSCNGTPTTCANISSVKDEQYYGCCAGDKVFWCDEQSGTWELKSVDCASEGMACTYDPKYESMYCLAPPCTADSCPTDQQCVNGVCVDPPCTADSCPSGQVCVNQKCINDPGPGPGPGPGPTCSNLPPIQCTLGATECGKLVPFDPDNNPADAAYDPMLGYIDYPANGETWSNQYRSYIRRDLMMLIKHATAFVACKAKDWTSGNGKPLGLIDMSEVNGAIPGTSINQPGHPTGTHTNGFDIDVAYYQNGTADNKAREVCDHYTNGVEQYHCTATPHLLDVWRNALFIGAVHSHPSLRVLGCDGKVGPMVVPAITKLCADGWLSGTACTKLKLAFEETNEGNGWFLFHHHHMHVSLSKPSYTSTLQSKVECLVQGCTTRPAPGASSPMMLLTP